MAWKVNRRALVLACPLAYMGDDQAIHLTDGNGAKDLELVGPGYGLSDNGLTGWNGSQMMWSPNGRRLGFSPYTLPGIKHVGVLEPSTGNFKQFRIPPDAGFKGWLDSDHAFAYVPPDPVHLKVIDADTGQSARTIILSNNYSFGNLFMAYTPLSCFRGRYATMLTRKDENDGTTIVLLKKDFSLGKVVWDEPSPPKLSHWHPRVDPSGEWVAWSVFGLQGSASRIGVKRVNDGASVPFSVLGNDYATALFCDWTEDGKILANVARSGNGSSSFTNWTLVILDKSGKLVREVRTAVAPKPNSSAAWRKYEHW
jgi:hypothetical protein